MKKVGADQTALSLVQRGMRPEGVLHFGCARLENVEQVAVAAIEIL